MDRLTLRKIGIRESESRSRRRSLKGAACGPGVLREEERDAAGRIKAAVEHSLPDVRSPWRTATLVASGVAALELVALVVLGVVLLAKPVSDHVRQAAEAKVMAPVNVKPHRAPLVGAPKLTRSETSVIVLNGNGRAGAAATSAEAVRRFGYTIGTVGNAPRSDFTRTLVMFRKGYQAEGARLAKDLHVKIVGPLDGLRPADMLGAHVALVVGA